MTHEWPRRACLDRFTPAEAAIYHAVQVVEEAGAHPLLTDAVNLLAQARERVADYVDSVTPPPKVKGPVLMAPDNAEGWKLEDLLARLQAEIAGKCAKIAGDGRPAARHVLRNNQQIIGLLAQAEALQRDSYDVLAAVGPDQGPLGKPRIGTGS